MNFEEIINYNDLNDYEKEQAKAYIYDFVNNNKWLDNRVNFSFSRNRWLNGFITKDDLKQEFYLQLMKENTISKLLERDLIGKLKYVNTIFSNVLSKQLQKYYNKASYSFDEDMCFSNMNVSSDDELVDIEKFFIDETLEKRVIMLLKEGMTQKDIMNKLELSRGQYDNIRENIKKVLREELEDDYN